MARVLIPSVSLAAKRGRKNSIILRVHARSGILHAGFDLSRAQTAELIVELSEALAEADRELAVGALANAINAVAKNADNSAEDSN